MPDWQHRVDPALRLLQSQLRQNFDEFGQAVRRVEAEYTLERGVTQGAPVAPSVQVSARAQTDVEDYRFPRRLMQMLLEAHSVPADYLRAWRMAQLACKGPIDDLLAPHLRVDDQDQPVSRSEFFLTIRQIAEAHPIAAVRNTFAARRTPALDTSPESVAESNGFTPISASSTATSANSAPVAEPFTPGAPVVFIPETPPPAPSAAEPPAPAAPLAPCRACVLRKQRKRHKHLPHFLPGCLPAAVFKRGRARGPKRGAQRAR